MKKRWFIPVLVLALLLTACGGGVGETASPSPTAAATPTPVPAEFALPYYATASLHPITGESKTNLALAALVYEGLFAVDNKFAAQRILCNSYSVSPDGLVWTLTLKDCQFSNGEALTPQDVVSSLTLAKESKLYAPRMVDIKTVQGEGDRVTLTLHRPRGELPVLLDVPIVRAGGEGEPPLGTGRYAFAGEGKQRELVRNQWADPTLPETILLTGIQGVDDLVRAFDTKEISLVSADLTGTDALGYSGGYEVWDYPTTAMVYLGFRSDRGPCVDPVLRRAIAQTLNREAVVTALYSQHGTAAVLPLSPHSKWYNEALAQSGAYNPKQAAASLTEGGYTLSEGGLMNNGKQVRLTLLVNTDNAVRLTVAEQLAGELGGLGLDVTVNKLPWNDYTAAIQAGEFDLYLAESILPADFDLTALLGVGGELNYGRWTQGETQTLLEAFRQAQAPQKAEAATALYSHLAQQAPIAPICFKTNSILTQWGQVMGLTPTKGDPFAGEDWSLPNN